ncbi:amidohydrolase family protein [Thermotoga sp. KOL6]|uniref:amidohydrolase family protein n=1 Tax=Thermotoga sp. KOL6 TaxID=126741 RepID=UPI000C77F845|nr:amidohydrolase family protein [Thermotoga sp. KOL6]PLV59069.1 amidohydrolase [Thermotoga sp. KOL6]
MILKGALVWNGNRFVQKDLFVENGVFVEKSHGPSIDVKGYFLVPGFVDSHAHVVGTGFAKDSISFSSWDELFEKLNERKQENVIFGRGWSEEPDGTTLKKLDEIEKPIFLIRRCGHKALLNISAMKVLGIKTRYIVENLEPIYEHVFKKELLKFYKVGEQEFLKHGVTFVQSDDLNGVEVEELLDVLKNSRVRLFEKLKYKNLRPHYFRDLSPKVHVRGIKVFMDGSLGAKTAFISGEYEDGTHGVQLVSKKKLEKLAEFCDEKSLILNIHAIGDEAVSVTLDVLEKHPGHRIVHAQLIKEEDLKRLKSASLTVQPHFYFEDLPLLKNIKVNALLYPFRKIFEMGISISFSSDSPVSPSDPKYVAEHALKMGFSREETFYLMTEAGARQVKIKTGKIETGFKADFCLYERNPLLFEDDPAAVFIEGERVL